MSAVVGLHWADYLVMAVVLVANFAIGLTPAFQEGKKHTTTEFLTGDRKLRLIPVTLSAFMTSVSAIMVLGMTAEMYTYGTQETLTVIQDAVAFLIVGLYIVLILYPLKIVSTFEYYERRFHSKSLQQLLSLINVFDNSFYYALAMYAASTALQAGLPVWIFICASGAIVTIYTGLGGMKSAVWTNSFLAIIFAGGMVVMLVMGCIKAGGVSEVWHRSQQGGRLIFLNTNLHYRERVTVWNVCVFKCFTSFATLGVGQTITQHYVSLKSIKAAKIAVLMNIPFFTVLNLMLALLGLVVYAYYDSVGCDPLRSGAISSSNQLLPYFIVDVMQYPGFPGMMVSVFFCCSLSAPSGALASIAANLWQDILEPHFKDKTDQRKTLINKIIIVVFGCVAIGMAFLIHQLPGHVNVICSAVFGSVSGGVGGCLALGLFCPFGNAKGALVGVLFSMVLMAWINVGQFLTDPFTQTLPTNVDNCTLPANTTLPPIKENPEYVFPLYGLSFNWFSTVTCGVSFTVGAVASVITGGQDANTVDPALIIPLDKMLYSCLPKKLRPKCCDRSTSLDKIHEMTETTNTDDADNPLNALMPDEDVDIHGSDRQTSRGQMNRRLLGSADQHTNRRHLAEEDQESS